MRKQLSGKRAVSARRAKRQSGNAMLEAALIFLPMIAIFLGIIDVSLAVYVQSTLTSATREGARFAITFQSIDPYGDSCSTSQATCIATVVQNYAVGLPGGLPTGDITVNYYTANDLTNPVEVCNSGSCTLKGVLPQTLSNGKVVTYANQPGNVIEVVVANYPWNWLIPMPGFTAGKGITLGAASMDVLGALAVGTSVPPNP